MGLPQQSLGTMLHLFFFVRRGLERHRVAAVVNPRSWRRTLRLAASRQIPSLVTLGRDHFKWTRASVLAVFLRIPSHPIPTSPWRTWIPARQSPAMSGWAVRDVVAAPRTPKTAQPRPEATGDSFTLHSMGRCRPCRFFHLQKGGWGAY